MTAYLSERLTRDADHDIPIIESAVIQAVYSSGLARVISSRGDLHFVLFIEQPTADGGIERVVNLRLVIPRESAPHVLEMTE